MISVLVAGGDNDGGDKCRWAGERGGHPDFLARQDGALLKTFAKGANFCSSKERRTSYLLSEKRRNTDSKEKAQHMVNIQPS